MEKLYLSKTCLKMAGWGDASPLDPPMPALITMSLTTAPTSRFGFSMMRGKFCQSCVEVTAWTALAQFGHFTLKSRVQFQKGGLTPQILPLGAPLSTLYGLHYIRQNRPKNYFAVSGKIDTPLIIWYLSTPKINAEKNSSISDKGAQ